MAHTSDTLCFTAEVFVVYGKKVLLRRHDKYKIWLSIGGHIDPGEDPNEAALREVKEEVGLDVVLWDGNLRLRGAPQGNAQLIPPVAMNRHAINAPLEHMSMIYLAKAASDEVNVEYEGDRSDEWRWLSRDELAALDLRDDVRFYALMALDELGA